MSEIIIYTANNKAEIEITFDKETLWLSLNQIAELFERDKSVISRHLKKIFDSEELDYNSTVAKNATVQKEGNREVQRSIEYYNLDVVISVGYRVNSKRGTQFRQWATHKLNQYLTQGYILNQKRLEQLDYKYQKIQGAIKLAANVSNIDQLSSEEAQGILKILDEYAFAIDTIHKYDNQELHIPDKKEKGLNKLSYSEALQQIRIWREKIDNGNLFGNEKDDGFQSSLATIYQTFDGIDLYSSVEEKAANLIYFIVKNHSFSDGNKRIAAGLFAYFLDKNHRLYTAKGNKIIGENALVAITIMIAESHPVQKDMMIRLVVNLIHNDKN